MAEEYTVVSPKERLIVVLGLTGSGKSRFIDSLVEESVHVGHGLASATNTSALYSFKWRDHRKSRIWLLDTPGFDDTDRDDATILRDIASVLTTASHKYDLAGIIYLHPIVDVRMHGAGQRTLALLKCICGEEALKYIALVTTMWEVNSDREGQEKLYRERLNDLLSNEKWWGNMGKANYFQHTGNVESAQYIIDQVLLQHDNHGSFILKLRMELEEGRALEDTTAGREVNKELHKLQSELRKHKASLQQEYKKAIQKKDDEHMLLISQQKAELDEKLENAAQQQREMQEKYEAMIKQTALEHEAALNQIRAERDEAKQRLEQLEGDFNNILADREQDKQDFERDLGILATRIAALTAQGSYAEADTQRALVVRKKANYVVAKKQYDYEQQALSEPVENAENDYKQRDMAYNGRRKVVHLLKIDLPGFHVNWSRTTAY